MSKHSHWAKIKHGKGATDAKRGMIFTKLGRAITIAAKEKGPNPEFNFKLRLAIEAARSANMPRENIERAILRATGSEDSASLEELLYEGVLPGGVGVIIEVTSDNKNRTTGEIKKILSEYGGTFAAAGAVRWNFSRLGVLEIKLPLLDSKLREEIEFRAIEAGAEDIKIEDDTMFIYIKPDELERVKSILEKDNIKIDFAGLEWLARDKVSPDAETRSKLDKLFEALDESEEVGEYYTNLS